MLPILTTTQDIEAIVGYLKLKPTGASTSEARAALGSNVVDPRKISAYVAWGIAEKSGDKLKLTERGWRYARKTTAERDIFREVIDTIVPYRSALEWAFHQQFTEITNVDVAAHWHEHHSAQVGTDNENTLKDAAVCFFNLCEGAQLGKLVVGRRGQATRVQITTQELQSYIEAGPSALPESPAAPAVEASDSENSPLKTGGPTLRTSTSLSPVPQSTPLRIFITHGKNMTLVEQVETMLNLGGLESEVAEDEETTAIPVPEKVFSAMRRCTAGIIIVSADEASKDKGGDYRINENVLIEIGAAFVLYDRKVVLVWDKRLKVPSNLQGLYRCDFQGDEFTWSAGMKLMKAINEFKV